MHCQIIYDEDSIQWEKCAQNYCVRTFNANIVWCGSNTYKTNRIIIIAMILWQCTANTLNSHSIFLILILFSVKSCNSFDSGEIHCKCLNRCNCIPRRIHSWLFSVNQIPANNQTNEWMSAFQRDIQCKFISFCQWWPVRIILYQNLLCSWI